MARLASYNGEACATGLLLVAPPLLLQQKSRAEKRRKQRERRKAGKARCASCVLHGKACAISKGVDVHGRLSVSASWQALVGGVAVQHSSWLHGRRRRRRRRRAPRLSTGCDCRAGGQRLVGYGAAARAVFVGRASEPTENSELRARRPDCEPASGQGECGPSPSLRLAATQHRQHGRWHCERQVDATAQTQRTARTARLRRRRRRPAAANTGA